MPRQEISRLPSKGRNYKTIMTTEEKRKEYAEYLQTAHWRMIADKVKERAAHRCQVCNSDKKLEVHHRTYENIFHELDHLDDLVCLCARCHGLFHAKRHPSSGRKKREGRGRMSPEVRRHRRFFRRSAAILRIPEKQLRLMGIEAVKRMRGQALVEKAERRKIKKMRRAQRKAMEASGLLGPIAQTSAHMASDSSAFPASARAPR